MAGSYTDRDRRDLRPMSGSGSIYSVSLAESTELQEPHKEAWIIPKYVESRFIPEWWLQFEIHKFPSFTDNYINASNARAETLGRMTFEISFDDPD